mgnify:CR=1 FL=1|tara:strand:+ start:920 stop:1669 length:750 start_codon:yes stop_codon:yes gene_type:complete
MALTNDQKIQLMKEAYATGYKGSFTELFQQNDPEPGTDPELEPMDINPMDVPANSPAKVSLGTDMPPMEMRNQEAIEQANAAPSQELVQSYQSETAGSMPTGERVETVLENPSQYQEGGFKLPERTGKRDNEDGSYSTHIMRHETADGINWFAFPTLFQNEDGSWDDRSEQANKDWRSVAAEAERRGEVIHFGTDRDAAAKYAKTLGGTKQEGGYRLDNNYADNYIKDYLRKKGGYKWDLEKLKDFNKK